MSETETPKHLSPNTCPEKTELESLNERVVALEIYAAKLEIYNEDMRQKLIATLNMLSELAKEVQSLKLQDTVEDIKF